MAMDAVCFAAFGVDFQATVEQQAGNSAGRHDAEYGADGSIEDGFWEKYPVGSTKFGINIINCSKTMMVDADLQEATPYLPLVRCRTSLQSTAGFKPRMCPWPLSCHVYVESLLGPCMVVHGQDCLLHCLCVLVPAQNTVCQT